MLATVLLVPVGCHVGSQQFKMGSPQPSKPRMQLDHLSYSYRVYGALGANSPELMVEMFKFVECFSLGLTPFNADSISRLTSQLPSYP